MKIFLLLLTIVGLLHSATFKYPEYIIKKTPTSDTTNPDIKKRKKKNESIYLGLKKSYSTLIYCEGTKNKADIIAFFSSSLRNNQIKIITIEQYHQKHKEATENTFRNLNTGSGFTSDDLTQKLINYPYNIQIITLYPEFKNENTDTLKSLKWKVRFEPPNTEITNREMKDSILSAFTYKHLIKLLADSLSFYAK